MDSTIATFLVQNGLTNGAIYALLGVTLVLVFSLTRVIMLFVGEFVSFGALTLAALHANRTPDVIWLLLLLGVAATISRLIRSRRNFHPRQALYTLLSGTGLSLGIALIAWSAAPLSLPLPVDIALTLLLIVPMASYVYTLVYEPIEDASILTLLITAVGVHLALLGLGLYFFGPDGERSPALMAGAVVIGGIRFTWQAIAIYATTIAALAGLVLLFERTLTGTALRASAVNRLGARLVGIPTALAGQIAFVLAGLAATICGILMGPMTTMYYDTGFVIALKGFVAAVLGGLASYPLTALAALGIGLLESFSSFFASAYKDAIVFSMILPVLLLRSLFSHRGEDE